MQFRIIFIFILSFIGNNIFSKNIPESLLQFLNDKLSGLSIVSTDEYVSYWNDFTDKEQQIPYFCSGDFNGDDEADYAILFTNTVKQLYLYAFLTTDDSYKEILIDQFADTNGMIQIIVKTQPKGIWESIVDEITVPTEGVSVELIEESLSWSYYYKDGVFIQFLYD